MNILNNPFYILEVSHRDKITKIIEVSEEKSLFGDPKIYTDAKNTLISPLNRIKAEVNWVLGVSPTKIKKIIKYIEDLTCLEKVVDDLKQNYTGCSPLFYINIEKTILEEKCNISPQSLYSIIKDLCEQYEYINTYEVQSNINEARRLSSVVQLSDTEVLNEELSMHRDECLSAIMNAINALEPIDLIKLVTDLIDDFTCSGENIAPELVYSLVDSYELRIKDTLERKENTLLEKVDSFLELDLQNTSKERVNSKVNEYIYELKTWDMLAQPIQLRCMSKGEDYNGKKIGIASRRIAIELFNKGYEEYAESFLLELKNVFAEVGEIVERIDKDTEDIANIKHNLAEAVKIANEQHEQWVKDITCNVDVGTLFSNHLSIGEGGVFWKSDSMPLEDVIEFKWENDKKKNIILCSKTKTFVIDFGWDLNGVYDKVWNCLFEAVGKRIIIDMLEQLDNGEEIKGKDFTLTKDYLIAWNRQHERVYWHDMTDIVCWGEFFHVMAKGHYYYFEHKQNQINVQLLDMLIHYKITSSKEG